MHTYSTLVYMCMCHLFAFHNGDDSSVLFMAMITTIAWYIVGIQCLMNDRISKWTYYKREKGFTEQYMYSCYV